MTTTERPPLILLVDDNEDHRTIYAMVLEAAGFQVVEATDGTSAVRKARTMRPDVILLDARVLTLDSGPAAAQAHSAAEGDPARAMRVDSQRRTDPGIPVRARGGVRRVFAAAGDGGSRRRRRLSGLCADAGAPRHEIDEEEST